jgi:hypothetical protein
VPCSHSFCSYLTSTGNAVRFSTTQSCNSLRRQNRRQVAQHNRHEIEILRDCERRSAITSQTSSTVRSRNLKHPLENAPASGTAAEQVGYLLLSTPILLPFSPYLCSYQQAQIMEKKRRKKNDIQRGPHNPSVSPSSFTPITDRRQSTRQLAQCKHREDGKLHDYERRRAVVEQVRMKRCIFYPFLRTYHRPPPLFNLLRLREKLDNEIVVLTKEPHTSTFKLYVHSLPCLFFFLQYYTDSTVLTNEDRSLNHDMTQMSTFCSTITVFLITTRYHLSHDVLLANLSTLSLLAV